MDDQGTRNNLIYIQQCQGMLILFNNCCYLSWQYKTVQNFAIQASAIHEMGTSRCTSKIQKKQRSHCQPSVYNEKAKQIYFCCIGYTKDFDYIDHNRLWLAFKKQGYMGSKQLNCLKLRNKCTRPDPLYVELLTIYFWMRILLHLLPCFMNSS